MADIPDPVVATPPAPPPPRRNTMLPLVAGGALAAVLGFAAAQLVPNGWPLGNVTDLQSQLAAQSAELAALKSAIAALPTADPSLATRLTALESSAPDLAPLIARLDALDHTVQTLPTSQASPDLTAMQAQIDALKSGGIPAAALSEATAALDAKLAATEASLAAITATAEATAATTFQRAALHQLQAALDSGAPYTSALTDLAPLPPVLTENAAAGLPTMQSLRQSFPDAARAALEAALRANMGESWTDRASAFLRGQTGARSLTPRDGTDPDAVLSRAEAALATGDLTAALTEITALPSEGQTAMANWLALAHLRQDAAAAVQSLVAAAGL